MSIEKINPRFAILVSFIAAVGILRVINATTFTAWSNFTPVGAMAMFGGAYFSQRWKAFAFPLLTLFLGDAIIYTLISSGKFSGRIMIYLAFSLIVLIGILVIKKVTVKRVGIASVLSTIGFWLIADFAVWMGGGTDIRTQLPLTRDLSGLMQCYWQGFPYMINFLLGTLFYSALMFGTFEWMQRRFPLLDINNSRSAVNQQSKNQI